MRTYRNARRCTDEETRQLLEHLLADRNAHWCGVPLSRGQLVPWLQLVRRDQLGAIRTVFGNLGSIKAPDVVGHDRQDIVQ